jgi:uncharacterized alpha/beta hydrolase family protein
MFNSVPLTLFTNTYNRKNNKSFFNNGKKINKNIKKFILEGDIYMDIKTDETVLMFIADNTYSIWTLRKNEETISTGDISECLQTIFSNYDVKGIDLVPTQFSESRVLQYLIMVKI